jgi:TolA-binding protein
VKKNFVLAIAGVAVLALAGCGAPTTSDEAIGSSLSSTSESRDAKRLEHQRERMEARVEARYERRQAQAEARRQVRIEARRLARLERQRELRSQRRAEAAAAAAPAPAPVAAAAPNCTDGYSPCLAPASDYDCAGGSGDGPKYTGYVTVTGSDPYGLDSDGDGSGCES